MEAFGVDYSGVCPPHCPVQLGVATLKLKSEQRRWRTPDNAADAFYDKLKEDLKELEGSERARQKKDRIGRLHKLMDEVAEGRRRRLEEAARDKDSDRRCDLIIVTAEQGVVQFPGLDERYAARIAGRCQIVFGTKSNGYTSFVDDLLPDSERVEPSVVALARRNVGYHTAQAKRLINIPMRMLASSKRMFDGSGELASTRAPHTSHGLMKTRCKQISRFAEAAVWCTMMAWRIALRDPMTFQKQMQHHT